MSLRTAISGGIFTLCIGSAPAIADNPDRNSSGSESYPSISTTISTTQDTITRVFEADPASGLLKPLSINTDSSSAESKAISEALMEEFRTINKEVGIAYELSDLLKEYRSYISTPEEKKYLFRKIEHTVHLIWESPELLFSVGTSLIKNNEVFGFLLIRRSLDLSKTHLDDMNNTFDRIISNVGQEKKISQDLAFMIETFGPFIHASITKKVNDPKLPESKRMQFKNALELIKTSR
ncbi:MAG: hypothetical protein PHH16_04450 [Candidatus Gracilibacteria bacterium]|nr:hypothetical protein [Candidatus Gracilibacteria bacterium]